MLKSCFISHFHYFNKEELPCMVCMVMGRTTETSLSAQISTNSIASSDLQIMNATSTPTPAAGSPAGLIAGLTIFFLLIVIAVGGVVYKYHSKIRSMLPSRQRRSQKKEDHFEVPQANPHQYYSLAREQSVGHTPIYENLTTRTTCRPAENMGRSMAEPEEDLYLQCDLPDDAIYNNDPQCNLAIVSDPQDDDVYIMPDT